jgi:ABC-type transport system involved in cytochrome c biogenesis permease subunit
MNTAFRALATFLVVLFGAGAPAVAQHDAAQQPTAQHHTAPRRTTAWSEQALELAAGLPVQDGGRIKPLETFANFTLLRFNGKRSVSLPDGGKLEALPWLLDVLFYPEQSSAYPMFKVDDIQAVEAIGITLDGKNKRDRYSFEELAPGVRRLFELADVYHQKEERDRTPAEQQIALLASNVNDFMLLQAHFDHARFPQDVSRNAALEQIFGGPEASYSQILARMPELLALRSEVRGDPARAQDAVDLDRVLQTAAELSNGTEKLALIPPAGSVEAEPEWSSPVDLLASAFQGRRIAPSVVADLACFEDLARSAGDPPRFEQALAKVRAGTVAAATARGEYAKIPLEQTYYRLDLIANALAVYVLGFVLSALLWLAPRNKWLYRAAVTAATAATALLVAAIVLRCMIRGRPPVSTLYETLLFVTAVGSIILLATEWISRQRMALSVNTVLGMVGLFLANAYETLDKQDTMPQLVAVLDTNFWLATHVTAITVGYAAGMVAAAIGSVYLIARLFGIRKSTPAFGKNLIRMTYGALCFGLIFSVVGTILGGIWANESWGRFWGWDPKENGALLICLTGIVILHARMGGYLRDFGIAAASAFLGTVIAFSWFGVNLLGVGLHSYGFTSGIQTALWSYYGFQWGLIAICSVHYLVQHSRETAAKPASTQQPAPHRGGGAVRAAQDRQA